jgi:hypothetical protein
VTQIAQLMDRYALVLAWSWHHRPTQATYRLTRLPAASPEGADAAAEAFLTVVDDGLDMNWTAHTTTLDAVYRPPEEPYEHDPRRHHERLDLVEAKLFGAGLQAAHLVRETPAGWLTLMEIVAEGAVDRILMHGKRSRVALQKVEERLGTFRIIMRADDPELSLDLIRIAEWARACSTCRCLVTGRSGELMQPGWMVPLSAEMQVLWREDPAKLRLLARPARPE